MKLLIHPLTQVISFSIVLITGDVISFPYIIYLYHAGMQRLGYGIIGLLAILFCFLSLIPKCSWLQSLGTICMIISFGLFMRNGIQNISGTFTNIFSLITLILFAFISFSVLKKSILFFN